MMRWSNAWPKLAGKVTLNTEAPDKGHIGPLIFEKQLATIQSHIDDAVEKGATVHCGGKPVENGGTWYPATVVSGVNHTMRIMTDETFGPVLPVMPFDSIDEAVELANDSRYGLSANVLRRNRRRRRGSRPPPQRRRRQRERSIAVRHRARIRAGTLQPLRPGPLPHGPARASSASTATSSSSRTSRPKPATSTLTPNPPT